MPTITALGTTYNLPNYTGELFSASPEDTPLLSAIGGLTGGESVASPIFEWQGVDLRDAKTDRQRAEGADAPETENRARFNASNVVEIHQEAVGLSYTRMGSTRMRSTGAQPSVQIGTTSVPADELAFQINAQLKQIARDVEMSFITGTFQNPTAANQPRKTKGLLQAIATNVATTTHTAANLTADEVLDLFQKIWENGGIQEAETRTIIVNAPLKRALTRLFIKEGRYEESSRNVGGVNLQTIETDFGRANVMLNRYAPVDQLIVASLEELKPAFLEIPGKGHFFAESLAKTGASEKVQIYGEIGLVFGNERKHGKLTVAKA